MFLHWSGQCEERYCIQKLVKGRRGGELSLEIITTNLSLWKLVHKEYKTHWEISALVLESPVIIRKKENLKNP